MAGRLWRRGAVVGGVVLAVVLSVGGVALAAAPLRLMVVGDSIVQGSSGDVTWRYQLHQHLARSGASFDLVATDRTCTTTSPTSTATRATRMRSTATTPPPWPAAGPMSRSGEPAAGSPTKPRR
jgi:hypothetical protein